MVKQNKHVSKEGDFGEKLVHGETRSGKEGGGRKVAGRESGSAASLLALLPNEFTAADLIKLRARKGQSVKSSAISMVLNRWRANNRIEKATETTWRKVGV